MVLMFLIDFNDKYFQNMNSKEKLEHHFLKEDKNLTNYIRISSYAFFKLNIINFHF